MAEIFNQILLEVVPPVTAAISDLLIVLLVGIITVLANSLRVKFKIQVSEATMSDIKTTVTDIVIQINQRIVDDLKAKSADGKLTEEEKSEVLDRAIQLALSLLDDKALKFLRDKYGDEFAAIELLVENAVSLCKSTTNTKVIVDNSKSLVEQDLVLGSSKDEFGASNPSSETSEENAVTTENQVSDKHIVG